MKFTIVICPSFPNDRVVKLIILLTKKVSIFASFLSWLQIDFLYSTFPDILTLQTHFLRCSSCDVVSLHYVSTLFIFSNTIFLSSL